MIYNIRRFVLFVLLCFAMHYNSFCQTPNLRRACVSDNDSDIILYWITPSDGCNGFVSMHIWARQDTLKTFDIIDSVMFLAQNTYMHKSANKISKDWQYFLIYHNLCNGDSSLASDTITVDITRPQTSPLDSVSINYINGDILLGWQKNTSPDVAGYLIVQNLGTSNVIIGQTVDTFFIIKGYNVKDSSYSFGIAAFDSCGLTAAVPSFHNTILLTSQLNDCKGFVNVQWTLYQAWQTLQYDIYVSRNGGPFILETTVDGITDSAKIVGLVSGDSVAIFVRATRDDSKVFSTSNIIGYNLKSLKKPKINYINHVTVTDDQKIEVEWTTDTTAQISYFNVLRSEKDSFSWLPKAKILYNNQLIYSYVDPKVDVANKRYYYMIQVFDNCGNLSDTSSNIANNILLNQDGLGGLHDTNLNLKWFHYQGWPNNGVSLYYVYRGGDCGAANTFNLLGANKPIDSFYSDKDLPYDMSCHGVCYYVEAVEGKTNPYTGQIERSRSNVFCELREHQIYFPSAFCPFGVNRRWKPVGSYIDYDKSYVQIFDRWGQLVKTLEGDEIRKGWDGKDSHGNYYPESTYMFWGYIKGLDKIHKNYSGVFDLIR